MLVKCRTFYTKSVSTVCVCVCRSVDDVRPQCRNVHVTVCSPNFGSVKNDVESHKWCMSQHDFLCEVKSCGLSCAQPHSGVGVGVGELHFLRYWPASNICSLGSVPRWLHKTSPFCFHVAFSNKLTLFRWRLPPAWLWRRVVRRNVQTFIGARLPPSSR